MSEQRPTDTEMLTGRGSTCWYDEQNACLDRRVFWDEHIYDQELERIFRRCWLFVAHESQIPKPGAFVSTYMGNTSVLVVRQRDLSIKVLVNTCPHRGNRVCHAELGNARGFVCNYHGWSFGLDGRMTGLHEAAVFERTPGFDKRKIGLPQAAQIATYKGLVFATFDPAAPPLDEYLGAYRWYLDIVLDNDERGTEFLPGAFKSVMRCNWKVPAENFTGDALHAGWTHDAGSQAVFGKGINPTSEDGLQININGHGWQVDSKYPVGNAATLGYKSILRYFREREPAVAQRLGAVRARMAGAISSASIFPNFSFLPGQSTFRVWHPLGPREVELHAFVLVNCGAPAEIKEAYRKGNMMTFSPTGLFEIDDGENWEFCTQSNRSAESRRQPSHYGLGLGSEVPSSELPGNVFRCQVNDANQRAFYRRWAQFMSAKSWTDISAC